VILCGYIPIHMYLHYSSPRKNAYCRSMNSLARDNGAGEEAGGDGDVDVVVVAAVAEEADQGKRTMKLHASER